MFAFGIWSEHDQLLFLCRDRLGVKPLFYCTVGSGLLFASEPKGLLALPSMTAELDRSGICEVFGLGPARTPGNGVFRGIREVKPGFWMQFGRGGTRTERYWQLTVGPHTDDLETTALTVRSLIEDSLQRQLVSDVPICALLSGGIDSRFGSAGCSGFEGLGLGPFTPSQLTTRAMSSTSGPAIFGQFEAS